MTGDQLRNLDTGAFIEYAGMIHNSIVDADRFTSAVVDGWESVTGRHFAGVRPAPVHAEGAGPTRWTQRR